MFEYIIPVFLFFATGDVQPEKYEYRFDENAAERVRSYMPSVEKAHERTGVPPKYILGVIYNESNGHSDVMGDNNRSYGLGQIRCRLWKDWLQKNGLDYLKRCNQLLRPYTNILGTAFILEYLKEEHASSWDGALEMYNSGSEVHEISDWKRQKRVISYRGEVNYFGKTFAPHYELYEKRVEPVLDTATNAYNKLASFQSLIAEMGGEDWG